MKPSVLLLLCTNFLVTIVFAQTCTLFDSGTYICDVDHPDLSESFAATLVINGSSFHFQSIDASCTTTGSIIGVAGDNHMVLTSAINDLSCMVNSKYFTNTMALTDCLYGYACNSFICNSAANPYENTVFKCDRIPDDKYPADLALNSATTFYVLPLLSIIFTLLSL